MNAQRCINKNKTFLFDVDQEKLSLKLGNKHTISKLFYWLTHWEYRTTLFQNFECACLFPKMNGNFLLSQH